MAVAKYLTLASFLSIILGRRCALPLLLPAPTAEGTTMRGRLASATFVVRASSPSVLRRRAPLSPTTNKNFFLGALPATCPRGIRFPTSRFLSAPHTSESDGDSFVATGFAEEGGSNVISDGDDGDDFADEDDDAPPSDDNDDGAINSGDVVSPGKPDGFYVVRQYAVPPSGIDLSLSSALGDESSSSSSSSDAVKKRLRLSPLNATLPAALTALDPETYPTLSRARKACRQGKILIHRGPLPLIPSSSDGDSEGGGGGEVRGGFDSDLSSRGRTADRVYPGDVIGEQTRLSHGPYSAFICRNSASGPSFDLPVVYEDDHLAVVNKPAGVLVYRDGNRGRDTVKSALPYVLKAPAAGTPGEMLPRPELRHRLDRPTSGLLIAAKTREAAADVTRQFEGRLVRKTYGAIVEGMPEAHPDSTVSSGEAREMGFDVDPSGGDDGDDGDVRWHVAECDLEGKDALTLWRIVRTSRSPKAMNEDGILSLVELKPKTGRHHQLRRQMAWMYGCPIVGDAVYGKGTMEYDRTKRWGRGLMLCSNRVVLAHPYFNTARGREEWERLYADGGGARCGEGCLQLSAEGQVVVRAEIDLPSKFETFLNAHERMWQYSTTR